MPVRLVLSSVFFLAGSLSVPAAFAASAVLQTGGVSVAIAPRLNFSPDEMALAQSVADKPALAAFYGANGLRPVFEGPQGARLREALVATVSEAGKHGISPRRYRIDKLSRAGQGLNDEVLFARMLARYMSDMTGGVIAPSSADSQIRQEVKRPPIARLMQDYVDAPDPVRFLQGLAPQNRAYRDLQAALASHGALVASPELPRAPEAVWRVGMRGGGVIPLRARLADIGFKAETTADPSSYDAHLSDAVARYQDAVGLPSDGIAGPNTIRRLNAREDSSTRAILVAMERLRWLGGEDLDARMVWVNIPEFTARIVEGGHEVFRTRVVVGKRDHDLRTPEFSDEMEYVVVNPRWNVPRSITVKEYLPRLKANRNAVSYLDIVDSRGRVIPRGNIDFGRYTAANFPYRMRQKPSEDNALGIVKFIFPNPWNIYLHDTPSKYLFSNSVRAYSHGCVRVGDPVDLATTLLSQQSSDPGGLFRRALNSGDERWLKLDPPLPVQLVYFTAYPDETGRIRYFSDIYGRDAEVWAALSKAGLELGAQND